MKATENYEALSEQNHLVATSGRWSSLRLYHLPTEREKELNYWEKIWNHWNRNSEAEAGQLKTCMRRVLQFNRKKSSINSHFPY